MESLIGVDPIQLQATALLLRAESFEAGQSAARSASRPARERECLAVGKDGAAKACITYATSEASGRGVPHQRSTACGWGSRSKKRPTLSCEPSVGRPARAFGEAHDWLQAFVRANGMVGSYRSSVNHDATCLAIGNALEIRTPTLWPRRRCS